MPYVLNPITGYEELWTDADWIARRDELVLAWMNSQGELERVKYDEMQRRKAVAQFLFNPNVKKGTESLDLGNGWILKLVKKINFGFVKANGKIDRTAIHNALDQIADAGVEGKETAYALINWNPTVSQTEYERLTPEQRLIVDRVIVTSDGSPTLTLTGPDD